MSLRARRLTIALVITVAILFAGRWTASAVAERWWAASISPEAGRFTARIQTLQFTLEAAGILIACAWFVGHLLVIYRAIGSVQVPRRVGNMEIREEVTSRLLVVVSVVSGIVAGVLVGTGVGAWWSQVALSWHGVQYGVEEPLLNHDVGVYVAQLPLWRLMHGYALLLALLALGGVLILYVAIGSVRWIEGRPAISDYARAHLGFLLTALALALVWGYLLEPYELVAGAEPVGEGSFQVQVTTAWALAGTGLVAAVMSAVWAWRPKHSLVASGWIVLAATSIVGHHLLPAFATVAPEHLDPETRRRLEALAYGFSSLSDSLYDPATGSPGFPLPAALWDARVLTAPIAGDSAIAANHAVLSHAGQRRPVWLVVRAGSAGGASLRAVADDRINAAGEPLYYQPEDTLAYPQSVTWLELSPRALRPKAAEPVFDTLSHGVAVGAGPRRLLLAWALQAGPLLGRLPPKTTVAWHLSPQDRLGQLAPFVEWRPPMVRLIGGEVVWLCEGYLASSTFPLVTRVNWENRDVGLLRAGFIGVVSAESGESRVYLRHTTDPLAEAWRAISDGVVQPASAIPAELARAVWYPVEQFRAQAQVLDAPHWQVGHLVGRADSSVGVQLPLETLWERDTSGTRLVVPYLSDDRRRIVAVLEGRMVDGWEVLRVRRFDSTSALPSTQTLDSRWNRFPSFDQIRDSVRSGEGTWEEGGFRFWMGDGGLGAYRPYYASAGPHQDPRLVWVSIALGERLGAGRNPQEAWENLKGLSAPLVPNQGTGSTLEEARRWMAAADSALRVGDFAGFGRAFQALRRVLTGEKDRPK